MLIPHADIDSFILIRLHFRHRAKQTYSTDTFALSRPTENVSTTK